MNNHIRSLAIPGIFACCIATASANEGLEINISYLKQDIDQGPVLSNILPKPEDAGLMGAELGIKDSNTTGRFLKQKYTLSSSATSSEEELIETAQEQFSQGIRFFVTNAPARTIKQLATQLPEGALIFNAGSADDELRSEACLSNVLHTLPSRAMLNDALAQWLKSKRLTDVLVITGPTEGDKAYKDAFMRSAKRFGVTVVDEKNWSFDADLRRTAQKEMPLFTQTKEYDVVFLADERGDFGEYVLYNTWYPRPVVGTQGLSPVAWHRVVEQWGAAQLQKRFDKHAKRWMVDEDYAAWAAVRSVAEAVTRTNKADYHSVNDFIRSDNFELAGFKGRKLNYRDWSGQLRQPIPLVHPRSLVSQSPQDGFLHPVNELDTLGFDKREVKCSK